MKLRTAAAAANNARRKLGWLLVNGRSHDTVPVFIVGSQRSGTTMLGECLGKSPEIENLGESDPRAFAEYFLRDDERIRGLIKRTPYPFMIFKPLKDSQSAGRLLALNVKSKLVWAYRNFADRINSAVKKFGRHPLDVFARFKRGDKSVWQLKGVSKRNAALIRGLDIDALSEADGAALMWYVRNSLFFDQALDRNRNVFLWSYDEFVVDPANDLRQLTDFLGASYYPFMVNAVHARSLHKAPRPRIDARIDDLCVSLYERLEAVRKSKIKTH